VVDGLWVLTGFVFLFDRNLMLYTSRFAALLLWFFVGLRADTIYIPYTFSLDGNNRTVSSIFSRSWPGNINTTPDYFAGSLSLFGPITLVLNWGAPIPDGYSLDSAAPKASLRINGQLTGSVSSSPDYGVQVGRAEFLSSNTGVVKMMTGVQPLTGSSVSYSNNLSFSDLESGHVFSFSGGANVYLQQPSNRPATDTALSVSLTFTISAGFLGGTETGVAAFTSTSTDPTIPEPASLALLFGLAVFFISSLRRTSRKCNICIT
jgi:hypothetical protein